MNDSNSIISTFYDNFPFPPEEIENNSPKDFRWEWSLEDVFSFCTGSLAPKGRLNEFRVLDAGCGTGVSTNYLIHQNPGIEILAVDIAPKAISIAQERLARSGAIHKAKIEIRNSSFLDLKAKDYFDYINSVGVLQHLEDPLKGLRSLSKHLKPGGIIHVYLYASSGRFGIRRIQESFRILELSSKDEHLKLAKSLLENLPEDNFLKLIYEKNFKDKFDSNVLFTDMFFNPIETSYSLERLENLVHAADLQFIDFVDSKMWNLERLLQGELLQKAKKMSKMNQFKLIEKLDQDINGFEFFLSKNIKYKKAWEDDSDLLATTAKISRLYEDGIGKKSTKSINQEFNLSDNESRFLQVLKDGPDQYLGLLPLGWEKSLIASTARGLHRKKVLLLYPP